MAGNLIDTNVIIRYLVETPEGISKKFSGVFSFFEKVETGTITIELTELVLFESFFVLTRIYRIPPPEASEVLSKIISFKGIRLTNRKVIEGCLKILQTKKIDLVDAYLIISAKQKGIDGIYSFDKDLAKNGLRLLEVN